MSEALLKSYPFMVLFLFSVCFFFFCILHITQIQICHSFFLKHVFLYFGCYWKFSVIKILTQDEKQFVLSISNVCTTLFTPFVKKRRKFSGPILYHIVESGFFCPTFPFYISFSLCFVFLVYLLIHVSQNPNMYKHFCRHSLW